MDLKNEYPYERVKDNYRYIIFENYSIVYNYRYKFLNTFNMNYDHYITYWIHMKWI